MPSHRADTPSVRRARRKASGPPTRRVTQRAQTKSLSGPQVGIAGVLGIATIAAPLSGVMAAPAPKAAPAQAASALLLAPAPAFPRLEASPVTAVEDLRVVPPQPLASESVPAALVAPATVFVARASRSQERSVLPGCTGVVHDSGAPNGQLPARDLCTLWETRHRLRADAAVALAKLNVAYQQRFGESLCLTDSYRSLASQQRLRAIKPGLAAVPGTSEHGWGLAVDLCDGVETGRGTRFQWLKATAPKYGWENPDWARSGGSGPYEPWHWEYEG